MQFGYYPQPFDRVIGPIEILTLPDLETKVECISGSSTGSWIFAPDAPMQNGRIFGLPKTHSLKHVAIANDKYQSFLIQCIGFLVGMRMSDTEAGFLDATPIKLGAANDIVWAPAKLDAAIEQTDQEWSSRASQTRLLAAMRGTIHSYLMSCTPTLLDFERFIYLYTALEGCHYVRCTLRNTRPTSIPHNKRVEELCNAFSMPTPWWADATNGIAPLRNAAIHEGLFFDEPLGFQIYGTNENRSAEESRVLLEMQKLTSRLVVALLGMPHKAYVSTAVDDRQRHLFE